jgi:hypothetical protein
MICPHCKKDIDYVLVFSRCCQHGTLEQEDGDFFISEWNRLDVIETEAIQCPECNEPLMHLVGEGGPLEDGEGTHVDLLSSGYEWTCPACQHLNTVSAASTAETVHCSECKIGFTVNAMHHCNGE